MKHILILISALILVSCANEPLILDKGNDVELILKLKDHRDIQKIEFTTRDEVVTLDKEDIKDYDQIIYNFNILGEDAVSTCIFTSQDTICNAEYVEINYKPILTFEDDELKSSGSSLGY
ncbi:MAG: hypothetical protein ACR2MS_00540 [Weeksellaceae bacterium]